MTRYLICLLVVLLASCSPESATNPTGNAPMGATAFAVRVVNQSNSSCYFEMSSPVYFYAQLPSGTTAVDTLDHAAGRYRLDWHLGCGLTDATSRLSDSTNVPGGFTLIF